MMMYISIIFFSIGFLLVFGSMIYHNVKCKPIKDLKDPKNVVISLLLSSFLIMCFSYIFAVFT